MTIAEQKQRAVDFLKSLENPQPEKIARMITDNFEFEMMGRLPGVTPVRGAQAYLAGMAAVLKTMFPNGLNLKFGTVIAEGPHVAVQAESDTIAGNGKKYANRYHFYLRFEGDKIAQVREYNDVNHVREVFFS